MNDIVGIKIKDKEKGEGAFITWGRLFDPIDDTELLEIVQKQLPRFGINNLEYIKLCYSLQEIAHYPYFYECLVPFMQEIIPKNAKYASWQKEKRKNLKDGHFIYFAGFMKPYIDYLEKNKKI